MLEQRTPFAASITIHDIANCLCSFPVVGGSKSAGHHESLVSVLSKENIEGPGDLKACADSECSGQDGVVSPPVEENEVRVCVWFRHWAFYVVYSISSCPHCRHWRRRTILIACR